MKKTLTRIQLTLATICASSAIWYVLSKTLYFIGVEVHPLIISLITFVLLLLISLVIYYRRK